MTYIGTAKLENGHVHMPDGFASVKRPNSYEAIDIGGDILLIASPLDRKRLEQIEALTNQSIEEHRKSLEGLAK